MDKYLMRLLAFSDLGSANLDNLLEFVEELSKENPLDLILYAGDGTRNFNSLPISEYANHFKEYNFPEIAPIFVEYNAKIGNIESLILNRERILTADISNPTDEKQIYHPSFIFDGQSTLWQNLEDRIPFKDHLISQGYKVYEFDREKTKVFMAGREDSSQINYFEEFARFARHGLIAVLGNDCSPFEYKCIAGENVTYIGKDAFNLENYTIIGINGSELSEIRFDEKLIDENMEEVPKNMGYTFTESEEIKRKIKDADGSKNIIILSHTPPEGILDLSMHFGIGHIGSPTLTKSIKSDDRIKLVVCGHSHLCGGNHMTYKDCSVVNCASHDSRNAIAKIAMIDLDPDGVTAIKYFKIYTRINLTEKIFDNRSKTGMLLRKNYNSIENFVDANIEDLRVLSIRYNLNFAYFSEKMSKAHLLINKKLYQKTNTLPQFFYDGLFIDIETTSIVKTDPEYTNLNSLRIQCISCMDLKSKKIKQFSFIDKWDEKSILTDFCEYIAGGQWSALFCYNVAFDQNILLRRIESLNIESQLTIQKLKSMKDLYRTMKRGLI
ncbi:MAG: hypothetical protein GF364_14125, partial [Candidatus Lokiarchaeota archaeon]|nr:hypothetical protein [Candidatus Lokiarchaeota archaeon]